MGFIDLEQPQRQTQRTELITKYYVATGSLPVRIQVFLLNSETAWWPAMCCALSLKKLFDTEREATEFALTQTKQAEETAHRIHAECLDRLERLT